MSTTGSHSRRDCQAPSTDLVLIGGGNGLSTLLEGLRPQLELDPSLSATVLVATTDNGGSSGRLIEAFSIMAVGDLRRCLAALLEPASRAAINYRFPEGQQGPSHTAGNLFLAAAILTQPTADLAVDTVAASFGLRTRFLASVPRRNALMGRVGDRTLRGQVAIKQVDEALDSLWIEGDGPDADSNVGPATHLVIAPGSLYTSRGAVLCAERTRRFIQEATTIVVVLNVSDEHEAGRLGALGELRELSKWVRPAAINVVIVDSGRLSRSPGLMDAAAQLDASVVSVELDDGSGRAGSAALAAAVLRALPSDSPHPSD